MTTTAQTIEAVRHTSSHGWDESPVTGCGPYTELVVEFEVRNPGPAHVCGIHYTTDLWKTRVTANAECVLIDGGYAPGGAEKWAVHLSLDTHVEMLEYVVFCLDHGDRDAVREIFNTNGGERYRVRPEVRQPPAPPPPAEAGHARASAPRLRQTLTGHGAAVRAAPADSRPGRLPAPSADRLMASAVDIAHEAITPYMQILMMRNFATNTWRFKANQRVSAPGCVIASPSEPGDPFTDQSYVNSWVRDSALCVAEAARADLPWNSTDLLDDYIDFSRITQQNAKAANRPGHACFFIDGQLRPWGIQSDGPALRATAALHLYDKLSEQGRSQARALVDEDVDYLLAAYPEPTINLWEETYGQHFFTRAVQKRCFELVADRHADLGLAADLAKVREAADRLGRWLEDHWHTEGGRSYYRSTVGGSGRGDNVDSSTILGAVYGELKASAPRLLCTAAVVWDSFRTLYNINHHDSDLGIGPLIGRYPEDEYDGDISEQPNIGHPWPLCTALFAEFYYRVALQLRQDGQVSVDDLTARFFAQIGLQPQPGRYGAGTPQFAAVQTGLKKAGDRMLDAVVYHSDHLEISEQYDRYSGYQKSVRNLTWSYAAYLSAVGVRARLAP